MKKLLSLFALLFCAVGFTAAPTAVCTWAAPTVHLDGTAITGALTYNLYQGIQGGTLSLIQTGLTGTTFTVIAGLTPGTTQCFALSAVEATQEGPQSAPACKAFALEVPAAVTSFTVTVH